MDNKCPACPTGRLVEALVETWQKRGSDWILLKNVPAQVCNACGERVFGQKAAERIAQLSSPTNAESPTGSLYCLAFDLVLMAKAVAEGSRPIPSDLITTTDTKRIVIVDSAPRETWYGPSGT